MEIGTIKQIKATNGKILYPIPMYETHYGIVGPFRPPRQGEWYVMSLKDGTKNVMCASRDERDTQFILDIVKVEKVQRTDYIIKEQ